MQQNNKREFILIKKEKEAENVFSLFFKPSDSLDYKYIPGQYVNIKPPSIVGHGKSYTISSSPFEEFVCLTIKKKGIVSSAVIDLNIDEHIFFEGPFGYFYPENDVKDIVMLAGGIGVTPFYSIIKDNIKQGTENNILLLYSNKNISDSTFFKELNDFASKNEQFNVVNFLTEQKIKDNLIQEYSRINEKLLKKYIVPSNNKCYYICGSIGFVNKMWKLLKKNNVSESRIFTESFY